MNLRASIAEILYHEKAYHEDDEDADVGVSCISNQLGNHKLTTWTLDTFLGLYDDDDADHDPSFETRVAIQ